MVAKKKKKKRVVKVKNIIILFIGLVFVIGSVYIFLTMPIKNVYIKGNSIVLDDEIMKISTLDTYPSFLLTKKSFVLNKILKNPYIQDVKVKKSFGNVVELEVVEYQPISIIGDKLVLSNGACLDNNYDLLDLPILLSEINDKDVFVEFAMKFSKIDVNILRQISEIEYSPVDVDVERFLLYMNDGNLVYVTLTKIEKLNKYDRIRDKLRRKKGIIYLDSGDYVELKTVSS